MKQENRINGRRGAFLLLWGIIYILLGLTYFISGLVPPALRWLYPLIETEFLGFVWTVPAIFAIIGSRSQRPADAYAWAALATAPVIWACLYFVGSFLTGEFTSSLGIIVFGGLAGTFMIVAGMEGTSDLAERLSNPDDEET